MVRKRRSRLKQLVVFYGKIFCFCLLIYAIWHLVIWLVDSTRTKIATDELVEQAVIVDIPDSETTEIIPPATEPDPANPYWDYIKINLMDVDFSALKATNPDVQGWLSVGGTNINYPFVQASDNQFYLDHSFDRSPNSAGWVFLDYRNILSRGDQNIVLYAHGRVDTTMFGSLKNILTSGWLDNPENYIVKLSTDYENTLWQVFSVYQIPTTSDYLQINFDSEKAFLEFTQKLLSRSAYNFQTSLTATDQILTLSTCYDDNSRVVLHAKLIKKSSGD